jgi:hypothetical protein
MGSVRTMVARLFVLLAFLAGVIGLVAGLTCHNWKLGPIGWFTGGALLALIGVFVLVCGAVAPTKDKP